MASTKVYYVILEDGDDEAHPNMFTIPIPPQNVRLGDIRASFPLKKHNYHFRFKKVFQNKFVWLDCVDENGPVPVYDGIYYCKVSRLGEISGSRAAPQQTRAVEQTAKQPVQQETTKAKQAASAPAQPQVSDNNDLFEWTDMDTSSPSPASNTPIPVAAANNSKPSVPKAPSASVQSDNLLDFLDSSSSTAPASSASQTISGMDFAWDSTFQSVPMTTSTGTSTAGMGFPGIGSAPPRTISPANIPVQQLPAKKASTSKVPTELGAEAAKQFTL